MRAVAPSAERRGAFLVCRVGELLCGLRLDHVSETMRPLPCEPIAGAPPFVRGVSVIRGETIPVVDAWLLLGVEGSIPSRLVVVNVASRQVALAVRDVVGIQEIADDAFHELPPLLAGANGDIVAALGTLDTELLVVLRDARLVPQAIWDLLERPTSS